MERHAVWGIGGIFYGPRPSRVAIPAVRANYPEPDRGTGLPAAPGGGASAVHEGIEVSI